MADRREFELLYRIETEGVEKIDGIALAQQKVALQTKFSADELHQFEQALDSSRQSGLSLGKALQDMTRWGGEENRVMREIAKTILDNDAAQNKYTKSTEDGAKRRATALKQEEAAWRSVQRAHTEALRENERMEKQKTFLGRITNASHPRLAVAGALGVGAVGYLGYRVATETISGIANTIKETTAQARELQNFSKELGLTEQAAFRLRTAAQLSGADLGKMGMAAHKLSDALKEPGGTGKETAKALSELGISLRQDLGSALDQTIHKLANIEDPAERAREAFKIFGRGSTEVLALAENMKTSEEAMQRWGLSLNKDVQDRLAKANTELEAFSVKLTLLKAQAVSGIVLPIITKYQDSTNLLATLFATGGIMAKNAAGTGMGVATGMFHGMTGGLFANQGLPNAPGAPKAPAGSGNYTPGDQASLLRLLHDSSKKGIADQLSDAKSRLANAEGYALADAKSPNKPGREIIEADKKQVQDLRSEVAKLEAQMKAVAKVDMYPEALARMKDKVSELVNANRGPVASLDEQYQANVRKFGLKTGSKRWADYTAEYGIVREDLVRQEQYKDAKSKNTDEAQIGGILSKISSDWTKEQNKIVADGMKNAMAGKDPLSAYVYGVPQHQMNPWFSTQEEGVLGRIANRGSLRLNRINGGPGEEGQIAAKNLDITLKEIAAQQQKAISSAKLLDDGKKIEALEEARFEAAKQGLEAVLSYEEQIAGIRKQQLDQTRQWSSELFKAGISGKPGATQNFFKQWGSGIGEQIIGNLGATVIGTMNSRLTLQGDTSKDGILGKVGKDGKFQENWFGKILSGTPLGLDPAKSGKIDPLQDATRKNTDVTLENNTAMGDNTSTMRGLIDVMGKMSGVDTSAIPGMGSGSGASAAGDAGAASNSALAKVIGSSLHPVTSSVQEVAKAISIDKKDAGKSPIASASSQDAPTNVDLTPAPTILNIPGQGEGQRKSASPVTSGTYAPPRDTASSGFKSVLDSATSTLSSVGSMMSSTLRQGSMGGIERAIQSAPKAISILRDIGGSHGVKGTPPTFSRTSAPYSPVIGTQNSTPIPSRAPSSGDTFNWLADLVGGPGGTTGFAGPVTLGGAPSDQSVSVPPEFDAQKPVLFDPGYGRLPDLTGQKSADGTKLADILGAGQKDHTKEQESAATGIGAKLGEILGGAKHAQKGDTIPTIFGSDASGSEKVGAGLAAGAQATAGILAAMDGFKKGGARGTIQGIAGTAAAIAPFAGPAAPFIEAGAAIAGLVGSLLPDGREQRQRQMTATVAHAGFVSPAARDYDFSAGDSGTGFSLGMGSSLRAGGQTANYNFTISALDAGSFVDWANKNPQQLGQAMLVGVSQSGNQSLNAELNWRAQNGGNVPPIW